MAESQSFNLVCSSLERLTSLSGLEARGTVRIALKEAGFDPREVSPRQMYLVLKRVLPGELRSRGVQNTDSVCEELARSVAGMSEAASDAPDAIFQRMGGD
jgi:hypothetical protein